jgi:hypothetical protein
MPKKRLAAPMETQPRSSGWRNAPIPMGASPTEKSKVARTPRSAVSHDKAETARRGALAEQRVARRQKQAAKSSTLKPCEKNYERS